MSDVSARHRPDRRQQLSIPRKLSIHYAIPGVLAGVVLGFMLQRAVALAIELERFMAIPPVSGNVVFVPTVILGGTVGLLATAYIWIVRQGKMSAGGRDG